MNAWTHFATACCTLALLACSTDAPTPPVASPAGHPQCVIFFEGTDCDPGQARSSCCTTAGSGMDGCWSDDEARSMKVYGSKGTVIAIFDHPDAATEDDYFVLRKHDDRPICVGSFEHPRGHLDPTTDSEWFYSGGDGLDGKVSTFRWNDPRGDRSGR